MKFKKHNIKEKMDKIKKLENNIKEIIDFWDPIELFPFAPQDEYDFEIRQIRNKMFTNKFLDRLGAGAVLAMEAIHPRIHTRPRHLPASLPGQQQNRRGMAGGAGGAFCLFLIFCDFDNPKSSLHLRFLKCRLLSHTEKPQ